jgi:DNA-dependent RNA polymerase auxiliary subunit epsilon
MSSKCPAELAENINHDIKSAVELVEKMNNEKSPVEFIHWVADLVLESERHKQQIQILWEIGSAGITPEQLENARKGLLVWGD